MFVAAPYLFAIYRLTILGETSMRYRMAAVSPEFWRFCGLSLAYVVLAYAPAAIAAMLPEEMALLEHVLSLPYFLILIPATVLFPAVAIGAPSAGWRWALDRTRGHWGRIFLISLATIAPFLIAVTAARGVLQKAVDSHATVAFAAFDSIAFLLLSTLGGVVASLVYQWLGTRQPQGL
jgi:hypothetical protein